MHHDARCRSHHSAKGNYWEISGNNGWNVTKNLSSDSVVAGLLRKLSESFFWGVKTE